MVRLLSRTDVQSLISMDGAIDILERAFRDFAAGNVKMPVRTPIPVPENSGVALFMPAYIPSLAALGAKVVTVYGNNPPKHKLPAVLGTIILLDPETGKPVCIMEAGFLTAVRTGAVSGLATKHLARDDAKVHVLFGTGVQAGAQARAVACARKLERCIVHSIDTPEMKRIFAQAMFEQTGVETVVAESPEDAVRQADILTLATSSKEPIIDGNWVKPGTHINGIGSHAPAMREIDAATVAKSVVVCDSLDACKAEAGDLIIPVTDGRWSWDRVRAELGEVVAGMKPGRTGPGEITLFKSCGLALQDMATASFVYKEALAKGVGKDFDF